MRGTVVTVRKPAANSSSAYAVTVSGCGSGEVVTVDVSDACDSETSDQPGESEPRQSEGDEPQAVETRRGDDDGGDDSEGDAAAVRTHDPTSPAAASAYDADATPGRRRSAGA